MSFWQQNLLSRTRFQNDYHLLEILSSNKRIAKEKLNPIPSWANQPLCQGSVREISDSFDFAIDGNSNQMTTNQPEPTKKSSTCSKNPNSSTSKKCQDTANSVSVTHNNNNSRSTAVASQKGKSKSELQSENSVKNSNQKMDLNSSRESLNFSADNEEIYAQVLNNLKSFRVNHKNTVTLVRGSILRIGCYSFVVDVV